MIGVAVHPDYHSIVGEFFELFKTPWEFLRPGVRYDVVLQDSSHNHQNAASLTLLFCAHGFGSDDSVSTENCRTVFYGKREIPIYGGVVCFGNQNHALIIGPGSESTVAYRKHGQDGISIFFGYDLFHEVKVLLTNGQPASKAKIPALDLHILILREMIVNNGVSLTEIPAIPEGYRFIACLTHDVDHPSLRAHRWDGAMFGFLYRATIRSVVEYFRGRLPMRSLMTNWMAALKLPLIHLGLAEDIWRGFTRYSEIEAGVPSSFFVIPFKGISGRENGRPVSRRRAARYCAREIAPELQKLAANGCEIGLHGIDAWCEIVAAQRELDEIRDVVGCEQLGVRMHWLFYDQQSPAMLDKLGFDYDSSMGYNETVGFRAGTSQVFKPLSAESLMELPLHIMDTALFYPSYLNLSAANAKKYVSDILNCIESNGGVVTINWHDRSIAPERLWGDFYADLVDDLKTRGTWIATASDVVRWFRERRKMQFDSASQAWLSTTAPSPGGRLPGFRVVVHNSESSKRDEIEVHYAAAEQISA